MPAVTSSVHARFVGADRERRATCHGVPVRPFRVRQPPMERLAPIAEPGTDHRRTVHRFPCRRRFHGPPIDIDGAARLGVRHATADHPRELLPSTFAACSGRCDVPENLLYHNLARRERPSTPWSGTSGRAATGSGRKGSTVTVGGPSRRRPTTVRTVAARMRGPAGTTGPLRLLVCRRLSGRHRGRCPPNAHPSARRS